MGPNVLALGRRVGLALAGNHETRRRLEAAGVDVRTYEGEEISQGRRRPDMPHAPARSRLTIRRIPTSRSPVEVALLRSAPEPCRTTGRSARRAGRGTA